MKKILFSLRASFIIQVLVAALLAAAYEMGWLAEGILSGNGEMEYILQTVGIMLMIILIPMALKLHTFKTVKARIKSGQPGFEKRYMLWSEVRLYMLATPLYFNLVAYYAIINSTTSFCALISAVALLFTWPSQVRMENETDMVETENTNTTAEQK